MTNIYKLSSNSCYIDTLLVILFKGASDKFVRDMVQTGYTYDDFKDFTCMIGVPLDIKLDYIMEVRGKLAEEFNDLNSDIVKSLSCNKLRILLSKCLPDTKFNVKFNPGNVYNLFTDMFPDLKIGIPVTLYKNGKRTEVLDERIGMFTMWDFLGETFTSEGTGKEYMWDDFDDELLVFLNTGAPNITNFGETGEEVSEVQIKDVFKGRVTKVRKFEEYILNGRYRLLGAIILKGVIPGRESGTHYVGYYLGYNLEHYYYDDIEPKLIPIGGFPKKIWKSEKGEIPQMYFYIKV